MVTLPRDRLLTLLMSGRAYGGGGRKAMIAGGCD
jgi:hypothetical protein